MNIFLLLFNWFLYLKPKLIYYKFRNIDYSFLNLSLNKTNKSYFPYHCFGTDFLNFTSNNLQKKAITLLFTDFNFNSQFHNNEIKKILKIINNSFSINITNIDPDYLIYSNFGCNHLKRQYNNAIRIAFLSENQIPDFNVADYCIGYSHINYFDRFFKRQPYFYKTILKFKYEDLQIIRKNVINGVRRKKFCAAVISSNNYRNFRLNFINELNKYKKVDMGGRYQNNVGIVKDKIEFLSAYKFSIAMENSEGDGYLSEKIIESFLAGTIPIYYGDYMLDEFINPKAYIYIKGEKDLIKKINYIIEIDNNDRLYKSILNEEVLINYESYINNEEEYYNFILHIFNQEKQIAKRKGKSIKYY